MVGLNRAVAEADRRRTCEGYVLGYDVNGVGRLTGGEYNAKQNGGVFLFTCQFTIGKGQSEGKQFYLRFFDLIGESVTGTLSIYAELGPQVLLGHVVEPIKDPIFYLANDIFNGDAGTLIAKIGTSLVASPGGIERTVMGQDSECDHFKLAKDVDQDMEDFTPIENQQLKWAASECLD